MDSSLANVTEDQRGSIDQLGEALNAAALSTLEEALGRRKPGEGGQAKKYPARVLKKMMALRVGTTEWRKARSRMSRFPSEVNREDLGKKLKKMEDLKEVNDEMMRAFWEKKRVKVMEELSGKGVEATKKFWSFVAAKHCKPTVFDSVEKAGSEELVTEEAEVKTEVECFLKDLFHGKFTPFDNEEEDPQ